MLEHASAMAKCTESAMPYEYYRLEVPASSISFVNRIPLNSIKYFWCCISEFYSLIFSTLAITINS